MGLMGQLLSFIFGGGRNVIAETAHVFRENAEAAGQREVHLTSQALAQYAAEFAHSRKSWFDRAMDGLNRLPRPMLAFGTLVLFVVAMVDPVWFASRMQGIALVPDPLWWLMGAIVSFYFGARHQVKAQEFQASIAQTMARVPQVVSNTRALQSLEDEDAPSRQNAALAEWSKTKL